MSSVATALAMAAAVLAVVSETVTVMTGAEVLTSTEICFRRSGAVLARPRSVMTAWASCWVWAASAYASCDLLRALQLVDVVDVDLQGRTDDQFGGRLIRGRHSQADHQRGDGGDGSTQDDEAGMRPDDDEGSFEFHGPSSVRGPQYSRVVPAGR